MIVRPDSLYDRSISERHRIVFYIGHLEAFGLESPTVTQPAPFDETLDRLFAFGIDPLDGGLPTDRASDWPALEHVRHYAARVREALDTTLENHPEFSEHTLHTAIEHRLMHAETLAYMLHQLPLEKKIRQLQVDVP